MFAILFFTDTRRDWRVTENRRLALERKHIVRVRRTAVVRTLAHTRGKVILRVISSNRNSIMIFSHLASVINLLNLLVTCVRHRRTIR